LDSSWISLFGARCASVSGTFECHWQSDNCNDWCMYDIYHVTELQTTLATNSALAAEKCNCRWSQCTGTPLVQPLQLIVETGYAIITSQCTNSSHERTCAHRNLCVQIFVLAALVIVRNGVMHLRHGNKFLVRQRIVADIQDPMTLLRDRMGRCHSGFDNAMHGDANTRTHTWTHSHVWRC
jgi:hypothetical protein